MKKTNKKINKKEDTKNIRIKKELHQDLKGQAKNKDLKLNELVDKKLSSSHKKKNILLGGATLGILALGITTPILIYQEQNKNKEQDKKLSILTKDKNKKLETLKSYLYNKLVKVDELLKHKDKLTNTSHKQELQQAQAKIKELINHIKGGENV